jgi:hypothetical protein
MSATTFAQPEGSPQSAAEPKKFGSRIRERVSGAANPVWRRELQESTRANRRPWIVLGLSLSASAAIAGIGFLSSAEGGMTPADVGKFLYQVLFSLAAAVVAIAGAGTAAGTLASERDGHTAEALQLSQLSPRDIARGKLCASIGTMLVYIGALVPAGAIPYVFGGVTAIEVLLGFAFLTLFSVVAVTFGLAGGATLQRTRAATVLTVALAALLFPALYIVFGFGCNTALLRIFPAVQREMPIWWPVAMANTSITLRASVLLALTPLAWFAICTTLFYEVAVAQLSETADDRTSALKRWFLGSLATLSLLTVAIPSVLTEREPRLFAAAGSFAVLASFLVLAIFLVSGDARESSRRVAAPRRAMPSRTALTSWPMTALRPGIVRSLVLVPLSGSIALLGPALIHDQRGIFPDPYGYEGAGRLPAAGVGTTVTCAAFAWCFVFFLAALTSYLRSHLGVWRTRCAAMVAVAALSIAPLLVSASLRADRTDAGTAEVFASPSPAYVVWLAEATRSSPSTSRRSARVLEAGATAASAYLILGLALFYGARRRLRALSAR